LDLKILWNRYFPSALTLRYYLYFQYFPLDLKILWNRYYQ
jgi:hypothetical protein